MERGMHNLLSMQDFSSMHKFCMHKFCKKSADFGLKRNPQMSTTNEKVLLDKDNILLLKKTFSLLIVDAEYKRMYQTPGTITQRGMRKENFLKVNRGKIKCVFPFARAFIQY